MSAPSLFDLDLEAIAKLPEGERRERLAAVGVVHRAVRENPLLGYMPHEGEKQWKLKHGLPLDGSESRGQREYHEITAPLGAFVAGNRAGKTHCGTADDLIQALPLELVPPWLQSYKRWGVDRPFFGRIVVADLARGLEKIALPKMRALVPRKALWKGSWDKAYSDKNHLLRFARGDTIDFLSHDMDVDAFAGDALHRVRFDEEPPGNKGRAIFEESSMRLTDYDGDMRFTMTPLLGLSWTYPELMTDQDQPRQDEDVYTVVGDLDHNPHLSERGKRIALSRMNTEEKRAARKEGRFVHFAGSIYHEFDPSRHVIPDSDFPRDAGKPTVRTFCAIDPGTDHPAAVVWAWLDEHDTLVVFRSFKLRGLTVADIAKRIHGVEEELHFRPQYRVIDPAARNKQHATGRSLQMEYAEHGIHTLPGQNSRQAGFNRVKERLRPIDEDGIPGEPTLYVMASNEELIEEFKEYRWKPPPPGESVGREEPVKVKDDLLDALRYLVMSRPSAPPGAPKPEDDVTPSQRAFRQSLKRLGRKRRARIGGVV